MASVDTPAHTPQPLAARQGRSALAGTKLAPWVFIAPFFILLFAFSLGPGLYSLWMSTQSDQSGQFIGLQNYQTVVQDSDFQSAAGVIWQCVYTLAPLFCVFAA